MTGDFPLTLSARERDELLQTALGDTRVELHHTHFSPGYREHVKEEEATLRSLLNKLRPVAVP